MKTNRTKKCKHTVSKLKLQIIRYFITSGILGLFIALFLMGLVFVALEHLWREKYDQLIMLYQQNVVVQWSIGLCFLFIFIFCTFFLFIQKMNSVTNAIAELSFEVGKIAEGEFENCIQIHQNNELGKLAEDMNNMSKRLKESVEKEKLLNQEKYNLITNMSHDLKTPMMSIVGYVDFIAEEKYQNEIEKKTYCEIIKRKTLELNHNVNQLFELSKISSYNFTITKNKLSLLDFTEQIVMEYIPQFEENNMECRLNIPAQLFVMADVDSLKRIYENIINNTIKYAAEGKYIEIDAETIASGVKLIFRNGGKKINAEDIKNIFDKFYREKKHTFKEGSGCGLYIVKKIVHLHGGRIYALSNDQCTEFIIELPN